MTSDLLVDLKNLLAKPIDAVINYETSVFGGIPIAERREELKCGVGIVDLRTGKQEGHLEFASGVEEVFDVQVLPGIRNPYISGPIPDDSNKTVWVVPPLN